MTATAFRTPSTVIHGAGTIVEAGAQARRMGAGRVLVVSDRFLVASGVVSRCLRGLGEAGLETVVFDDVQPDPTAANVAAGVAAFRAFDADAVVALGGGSVLDAAKMIAVSAANPGPLQQFQGYHRIPEAGVPLIAIPTTAGTGSEATAVAVITDTAADTKMMILDPHLVPAVAIIDPELSATMPPPLTAFVGVDTLTHGIEAYVSRVANPLADLHAEACIDLVARFLIRAFDDPTDVAARDGMARAAFHGGVAFSNASVGLVHGMSRPVGALFHVPHGLSNAVLLDVVTRYSLASAPDRYARVATLLGGPEAAGALPDVLGQLLGRLAIPRMRDVVGVDRDEFEGRLEKMASDALASGSPARNPRVPDGGEIVQLYRAAW